MRDELARFTGAHSDEAAGRVEPGGRLVERGQDHEIGFGQRLSMVRADRALVGELTRGERLDRGRGDGDERAWLDIVEGDRSLEREGAAGGASERAEVRGDAEARAEIARERAHVVALAHVEIDVEK